MTSPGICMHGHPVEMRDARQRACLFDKVMGRRSFGIAEYDEEVETPWMTDGDVTAMKGLRSPCSLSS